MMCICVCAANPRHLRQRQGQMCAVVCVRLIVLGIIKTCCEMVDEVQSDSSVFNRAFAETSCLGLMSSILAGAEICTNVAHKEKMLQEGDDGVGFRVTWTFHSSSDCKLPANAICECKHDAVRNFRVHSPTEMDI